MTDTLSHHSTAIGTATGAILAGASNIVETVNEKNAITGEDILKTIVLAAIGALVSFCVTFGLKIIVKAIKKG